VETCLLNPFWFSGTALTEAVRVGQLIKVNTVIVTAEKLSTTNPRFDQQTLKFSVFTEPPAIIVAANK
jgi:hypothetical protein